MLQKANCKSQHYLAVGILDQHLWAVTGQVDCSCRLALKAAMFKPRKVEESVKHIAQHIGILAHSLITEESLSFIRRVELGSVVLVITNLRL